MLSREDRMRIEDLAIEAAIREWPALKLMDSRWNASTGRQNSFDLKGSRSGRPVFVEVKGTTNRPTRGQLWVPVTPGEVRFARRNRGRSLLFVLHSIKRSKAGRFSGGVCAKQDPWVPNPQDLEPSGFDHRVDV